MLYSSTDFIRIKSSWMNVHRGVKRVSYQASQDYKIQQWNKIPASHSAKTFARHTPTSKPRLCIDHTCIGVPVSTTLFHAGRLIINCSVRFNDKDEATGYVASLSCYITYI